METMLKNQQQKRAKGKYNRDYNLAYCYKQYLKENPKDSDFYIDAALYRKINNLQFKKIFDKILLDSDEVILPYRLGSLSVVKSKTNLNKLLVDYNTSKLEGHRVYHLNDHTRGYKFKFRWRKHNAIFANRSFYSYIPTRTNKRELAKLIKSGRDYYQV